MSECPAPAGWLLLLRAHDHAITNRGWPLRDRIAAGKILWRLLCKVVSESKR